MRWGALVVNEKSGQGRTAEDLLEQLGNEVPLRLYKVSPDSDPKLCAVQAVRDGAHFVVAGGGDGTVSAVAAALVGTDVPLAILPLGTANSVARALELPMDPLEAARLWRDGPMRRIDTAVANGHTMVLMASVGVHAAAIAQATPERKRRWGGLAYLLTGIEKLRAQEPFTLTIEIPHEEIRCSATAVTVANLAPTQTLTAQGPSVVLADDGRLDTTILAADTLAQAVATGFHLLRTAWSSEPADRDDVGYVTSHRIRIDAQPPQPVLIDGEDGGMTPLEVVARPASLLVLAPAAPAVDKPVEHKLEGLPELKVVSV